MFYVTRRHQYYLLLLLSKQRCRLYSGGSDNSFVVIVDALDPLKMIGFYKDTRRVVTGHQYGSWYKGALLIGGLWSFVG